MSVLEYWFYPDKSEVSCAQLLLFNTITAFALTDPGGTIFEISGSPNLTQGVMQASTLVISALRVNDTALKTPCSSPTVSA